MVYVDSHSLGQLALASKRIILVLLHSYLTSLRNHVLYESWPVHQFSSLLQYSLISIYSVYVKLTCWYVMSSYGLYTTVCMFGQHIYIFWNTTNDFWLYRCRQRLLLKRLLLRRIHTGNCFLRRLLPAMMVTIRAVVLVITCRRSSWDATRCVTLSRCSSVHIVFVTHSKFVV